MKKFAHTKIKEEVIMDKNQTINCTVNSCAYNNPQNHICQLQNIVVEPCKNCHNGNPEDESMCGSYEQVR